MPSRLKKSAALLCIGLVVSIGLAEPALAVRDRRGRLFPGPYALDKDAGAWRLQRRSERPLPDARAASIRIASVDAAAAVSAFAKGEVQLVLAVAKRDDLRQLAAPLHGALRQRFQQDAAQLAALDFGAAAGTVVVLLEQHCAMLVQYAGGLAAVVDQGGEFFKQAGILERQLAVEIVYIEQAALCAGLGRSIVFVDGGGNAVHVQAAAIRAGQKVGQEEVFVVVVAAEVPHTAGAQVVLD